MSRTREAPPLWQTMGEGFGGALERDGVLRKATSGSRRTLTVKRWGTTLWTTRGAARWLGLSQRAVNLAVARGLLRAANASGGRHNYRLFRREELLRFAAGSAP